MAHVSMMQNPSYMLLAHLRFKAVPPSQLYGAQFSEHKPRHHICPLMPPLPRMIAEKTIASA